MSPPLGPQPGGMVDARDVRATGKQLRDVAARVAWRRDRSVHVRGSRLRLWRACFPRAQAVAVHWEAKDEDLPWVEGVLDVNLSWCHRITDAGLVHLGSATSVNLAECSRITDVTTPWHGQPTSGMLHCVEDSRRRRRRVRAALGPPTPGLPRVAPNRGLIPRRPRAPAAAPRAARAMGERRRRAAARSARPRRPRRRRCAARRAAPPVGRRCAG
jgi:hypothetical protein